MNPQRLGGLAGGEVPLTGNNNLFKSQSDSAKYLNIIMPCACLFVYLRGFLFQGVKVHSTFPSQLTEPGEAKNVPLPSISQQTRANMSTGIVLFF